MNSIPHNTQSTNDSTALTTSLDSVCTVDISNGRLSYVMIRLTHASQEKVVIRGRPSQKHADIYEQAQQELSSLDLESKCIGGGRIDHNPEKKEILVYGYSMHYGKADHSITVKLLREKFPNYTKITFTNEGY